MKGWINNQSKLAMNFLNIDTVFQNSASPEKTANIWRTEWDRISAIKFEAARLHFLSDVFRRRHRRRCLSSLINNGDGYENVTKKVNSRCLERYRAYSNSSNFSGVEF